MAGSEGYAQDHELAESMLIILGTTGDNSGNLSFGFEREGAILFPEVAVNYDVSKVTQLVSSIKLMFPRCTHQK